MNIIHIFGITILLMDTYSAIEEPKSKTQRTLLRKLHSYQPNENKPLMWNEALADVLVNKVKIFSFKKQNKEPDVVKEDLQVPEKSELTIIFSQIFYIYKKFIYDIFVRTPNVTGNNNTIETAYLAPEVGKRKVDTDEMFKETGVTFSDGPKSEVELVEPRYHGKQILANETEAIGEVSDNISEEYVKCPEGTENLEGKCVSNSRLILAIPSQCPLGYKKDRLGYCRRMF